VYEAIYKYNSYDRGKWNEKEHDFWRNKIIDLYQNIGVLTKSLVTMQICNLSKYFTNYNVG